MHSPTPAERKAILARLPKPPEGKVWKQRTGEQQIKATEQIVATTDGVVGFVGPILKGSWMATQKASALREWESVWYLVAARKRPAKPAHRYAYSEKGKFIEKFSEGTYQIFYHDGVRPEQKRVDLYSMILSSIERGIFKEISRYQFLAKIKEWGFNEDGTKMAAPPKVRYFVNTDGFGGGTAYVRHDGDDPSISTCVQTDGSEVRCGPSLDSCVAFTKSPWSWKEITESEAKALLTPPKTELELAKEALTAANARISELEAKIASAQGALS